MNPFSESTRAVALNLIKDALGHITSAATCHEAERLKYIERARQRIAVACATFEAAELLIAQEEQYQREREPATNALEFRRAADGGGE